MTKKVTLCYSISEKNEKRRLHDGAPLFEFVALFQGHFLPLFHWLIPHVQPSSDGILGVIADKKMVSHSIASPLL
jgi:hypothetical protein